MTEKATSAGAKPRFAGASVNACPHNGCWRAPNMNVGVLTLHLRVDHGEEISDEMRRLASANDRFYENREAL